MLNYPASEFIADNELEFEDLLAEITKCDPSVQDARSSSIDPSFARGLVFALPASLCVWAGIAYAIHSIL